MRIPLRCPDARAKRFDAVGFGLNQTDILAVVPEFPRPGSKGPLRRLAIRPGGQAATAMTACARLGWRASYVGRFGDDAHGQQGRESLRALGVATDDAVTVEGAPNGVSVILVDERSGDRTVRWTRDPRLAQTPETVSADAVCAGRVLLVDCHDTAASIAAAGHARDAGVPTIVDVEHLRPHLEDLLARIDLIVTAEGLPRALTGRASTGEALQELFRRFRPALACTTLGAEGSLCVTAEGEFHTPAFPVEAVDTTGAGDVFRGGLISGWFRLGVEADVREVIRYATAAAALKCRALGARGGIPTHEEVETLLGRAGGM